MKFYLSIFIASAIQLFVPDDSVSQFKRLGYFHIYPTSFYLNPHTPGGNPYCYADSLGHLFTAHYTTGESHPVSTFPLGTTYDYVFLDPATGFVCGDNGILRTRDSGWTWSPVPTLTYIGWNWKQFYLDSNTGKLYALSSLHGLWRSTDKGETWGQVIKGELGGMTMYGSSGVITGADSTTSFYTEDGGMVWSKSTMPLKAGRPAYYVPMQKFLAVSASQSTFFTSENGDEWTKGQRIQNPPLGHVYSDCINLFVPAQTGVYQGVMTSMDNNNTAPVSIHYACFVNNALFWVRTPRTFEKIGIGVARIPASLEINADDQHITVLRCSSITKQIDVKVLPTLATSVEIAISTLVGHPSIQIVGDSVLRSKSSVSFMVKATGTDAPAEAVFQIKAERCLNAYDTIRITVEPSSSPVKISSSNVPFGYVNSCKLAQRWLMIRNNDCNAITVESASLTQAKPLFSISPESTFPRVLLPYTSDSILFTLDARAQSGQLSAIVSIKATSVNGLQQLSSQLTALAATDRTLVTTEDTVRFTNAAACQVARDSLLIENVGCERVSLDGLSFGIGDDFSVVGDHVGTELQPGENRWILIETRAASYGDLADQLLISATTVSGKSVSISAWMRASVPGSRRAYDLTQPGIIGGLTTCGYVDTSFVIRNGSDCDALRILSIRNGSVAVEKIDGPASVTLPPGDSVVYRYRLHGDRTPTIDDLIEIETDLFGRLAARVAATPERPKLDAITISTPDSIYATTRCAAVTKEYSVATIGCGYLPLGDVSLLAVGEPSSKFTIRFIDPVQEELVEGDTIRFAITYDPDLDGSNEAQLRITDDNGGSLYQLGLHGSFEDTKTTFGLALTVDQSGPITTAQDLTAKISATEAVNVASGLQSIRTELHFDRDLFRIGSIEQLSGVQVTQSAIDEGEVLVFTSSAFELAKDQTIATVTLEPFVTERTSTELILTGLTLNDGDADFERCVMMATSSHSISTASVELDCKEEIVHDVLGDRLSFTINTIYPQPATSGAGITLNMYAEVAQTIELSVVDMLGRQITRELHALTFGESCIRLQTLPAGFHHLIVRGSNCQTVRPVVVR
ncbi:MAG TPA: hypothetical protein VFH43_06310 [Candidatus Kapabacteria bacterium]|nr:hypothetical protein [Candidatus Kapabacteria bacterium]